ncbi:hypothetical protein R3W88_027045 [Solanum pinnatisectum]|uniref:RNase H type-1 domain-containing protein n=1 Tax=Solanum pinnatisectum TaxID=50273 RepID=A0AAV9LEX2_9SOLN|nr:hypothetical protein R3W88_027045 [Solanum pinnatisectum]
MGQEVGFVEEKEKIELSEADNTDTSNKEEHTTRNWVNQLFYKRRAPTQDAKKDSGDQEGALTVGEHVQQKDKEKCGDDSTDTLEVVTTVNKALTIVMGTDESSKTNIDLWYDNLVHNSEKMNIEKVQQQQQEYDMQEVVQKHLDVVNNVNMLDSETNGIDGDKGKDAYPEVENEQVDNGGDKTQSQQQLVEKKMEVEGLTEPLPHAIIASTFDSPVKVLYDIVSHNINEINEQQHMEVNDKISKEDADEDQNQHNLNHALKVADLSPDVQSKGKKNRANAETKNVCKHVRNLNDTIHKWWSKDCSSKLRPLFKVVPSFINWQIWKRRNIISHRGNMSFYGMVMEVNINLYHLDTFTYQWLQNIPNTWHLMLVAFCIRNDEGNLIHAESFGLGITSVLMSETMALRRGLEYSIIHQYLPVILETDSLMLQKILNGIWEVSWSSRVEVKRINGLRINVDARVEHTLREGNTFADYLCNSPNSRKNQISDYQSYRCHRRRPNHGPWMGPRTVGMVQNL